MSDSTEVSARLDRLFARLQADMPELLRDMDAFFDAFEERSFEILAVEDSEAVQTRLMKMLEEAGVR